MIEIQTFTQRGQEIRDAMIAAGVLRPLASCADSSSSAVAWPMDDAGFRCAARHISEVLSPAELRALAGQPHVRPSLAVALLACAGRGGA
jgi:hypothetical protein